MKEKTLADVLTESFDADILLESEILTRSIEISAQALKVADGSGLSRRDIAKRMGMVSPSTVQRLVRDAESGNPRLQTLIRFAVACGYQLDVSFVSKEKQQQSFSGQPTVVKAEPAFTSSVSWPTYWPATFTHAKKGPDTLQEQWKNIIPFPEGGRSARKQWRLAEKAA